MMFSWTDRNNNGGRILEGKDLYMLSRTQRVCNARITTNCSIEPWETCTVTT